MGDKYRDPVSEIEHCLCTDADYGWSVSLFSSGVPLLTLLFSSDYNYSRKGTKCVPIEPEPIPAGACIEDDGTYQGSSGYRLLAGNTCKREGGVRKDEPVTKDCTESTIQTNPLMTTINDAQLRLTRERFPTKLYVSKNTVQRRSHHTAVHICFEAHVVPSLPRFEGELITISWLSGSYQGLFRVS
jgi:hypothetical protein